MAPLFRDLQYESLAAVAAPLQLPAMFLDLDAFDHNVAQMAAVARAHGKRLRMATKSIRVPALIQRALDSHPDVVQGLMVFNAREAALLWQLLGARCGDFLLAYPTLEAADVECAFNLALEGAVMTLMVDSTEQVDIIAKLWRDQAKIHKCSTRRTPQLRFCLDIDMSYRPLGSWLHLGVRRSPIRQPEHAMPVLDAIDQWPFARLCGAMGYEAQIAGVPDEPGTCKGFILHYIKAWSLVDVYQRRAKFASFFQERGVELEFFNGGGSGDIRKSTADPSLTEVSGGSAMLLSSMFDDFHDTKRHQPALFFALRVTRQPDVGLVCCQSGGFIASGPPGPDKVPRPFLPRSLTCLPLEGCGEVQTPLKVDVATVNFGLNSPVFFRPAKAGEIAERFDKYHLLSKQPLRSQSASGQHIIEYQIVDTVVTYRGLGVVFY